MSRYGVIVPRLTLRKAFGSSKTVAGAALIELRAGGPSGSALPSSKPTSRSRKAKYSCRYARRELNSDSVSSLMVDNEAGAQLAIEHLYSLGHRKIAFIRGPKVLGDATPRWRGVRSFARSVRLPIDPVLVAELPDSLDPNSAFEGGLKLTDELLKHKKRFTAIMAFDDMTAFGAIRSLARAGISAPADCSVIGSDDVLPGDLSVPSLPPARQPMEALGSTAVGIIMEGINAASEDIEFEPVRRKLTPELVVRESTRALT